MEFMERIQYLRSMVRKCWTFSTLKTLLCTIHYTKVMDYQLFRSGVSAWQHATAYSTGNNSVIPLTVQTWLSAICFASEEIFCRQKSNDEIKGNVQQWLKLQVAKFFEVGILKLVSRYDKCHNLCSRNID